MDNADKASRPEFTPRQLDILGFMAEGLTDGAIAARLRISDRQVRREVAAMCVAAGVSGRVPLGVVAERLGLLTYRVQRFPGPGTTLGAPESAPRTSGTA